MVLEGTGCKGAIKALGIFFGAENLLVQMKKLLIGVLVLRMENGWIQPFQTQFTIPTMATQGIIVDVLDIMGANVLHTVWSM